MDGSGESKPLWREQIERGDFSGDHVGCKGQGGVEFWGERESESLVVRHNERGNKECWGTTLPYEDKVELVPGPEGRWRGDSVSSNEEKKSMYSGERSFSGGMLKSPSTTSCV